MSLSRRITVLLVAASTAMCGACTSAARPESVVDHFYTAYIAAPSAGLPEGESLARLRPFLSDRLHGLILSALKYRDDFIKEHPDEPSANGGPPVIHKPPYIEGDYFSSVFEGPREFKVSRVVREDTDRWKVFVRFWDERPGEGWEDAVLVTRERGQFVIDDVVYSGAGPFNPAGLLSRRLEYRDEAED